MEWHLGVSLFAAQLHDLLRVWHAGEDVLAGVDQPEVLVPHLVAVPVREGRTDDLLR